MKIVLQVASGDTIRVENFIFGVAIGNSIGGTKGVEICTTNGNPIYDY